MHYCLTFLKEKSRKYLKNLLIILILFQFLAWYETSFLVLGKKLC